MKKIKILKSTTKRKMINSKMAEIIRTLHKRGGAMSPYEIADKTGFAYITVRNYIKELESHLIITELKRDKALAVVINKQKTPKEHTRSKTKRYSLNYGLIYKNDPKVFCTN